jgi:hypothetical protein
MSGRSVTRTELDGYEESCIAIGLFISKFVAILAEMCTKAIMVLCYGIVQKAQV